MKSIRKIASLVLATLLLCSALLSTVLAAGIDTPIIPVPGENESGTLISPFYYTFSGQNATVVGYAGWQTDATIPATVVHNGTTYTVTAI